MRLRSIIGLLSAALALGAAGACSPKTTLAPNLPPETTLFVQFDATDTIPHTVPYQAHLFWLGRDSDGFVVAYEIRMILQGGPADPPWTRTTRTDSLFDVPTPSATSQTRFEVRAIDDKDQRDPTPAGQDFSFSNQQPTIAITNKLRTIDTTYASVSLQWNAVDPDGDASRLKVRVWMNGHEADARLADNVIPRYTVPSDLFREGAGVFRSGPRRVYVQAIDPGGFASAIDSMTWFVRQPCADTTLKRGRVLLIHDVASSVAGQRLIDSLWTNSVARAFPASAVSSLRLETTQPFRSILDLYQTFNLFDIVIWHRAASGQTSYSTVLQNYQDGAGQFLDDGGTFIVESLNLVQAPGTAGSLRQDWIQRYLNCDSLVAHPLKQGQSSQYDFSLNGTGVLPSFQYSTKLQPLQTPSGYRAFAVRDTHDVALWAPVGTLIDTLPDPVPLGVRALQPSGGQSIALALFLRGLDRTSPGGGEGAATYLGRILATLPPPRPAPALQRLSLRRSRSR